MTLDEFQERIEGIYFERDSVPRGNDDRGASARCEDHLSGSLQIVVGDAFKCLSEFLGIDSKLHAPTERECNAVYVLRQHRIRQFGRSQEGTKDISCRQEL